MKLPLIGISLIVLLLLPGAYAITVTPGSVKVDTVPGYTFDVKYTISNEADEDLNLEFYLSDDAYNNTFSDRFGMISEDLYIPPHETRSTIITYTLPDYYPVIGNNSVWMSVRQKIDSNTEGFIVIALAVRTAVIVKDVPSELVRPEMFTFIQRDDTTLDDTMPATATKSDVVNKTKTTIHEREIGRNYKLYFSIVTAILIFTIIFAIGHFLLGRYNVKKKKQEDTSI